jgi:hypothetical protein
MDIEITQDIFGIFEPEPGNPQEVKRFTMTNPSGFSAQVINQYYKFFEQN